VDEETIRDLAERLLMDRLLAEGVSESVARAAAAAVAATLPEMVEVVVDDDAVAIRYSVRELSPMSTASGSPEVKAVTLQRTSAKG